MSHIIFGKPTWSIKGDPIADTKELGLKYTPFLIPVKKHQLLNASVPIKETVGHCMFDVV